MSSLDPVGDLAGEFDSVSLDDDAPTTRPRRTSLDPHPHPPGASADPSTVPASSELPVTSATALAHGDVGLDPPDQVPSSSPDKGASLGHDTLQRGDDDQRGFESVSLDSTTAPGQPQERDDHRSSPSPSSASTAPHSPSLASTAPTTLHDPSSSTDVDAPATATDGAPVASTSAPAAAQPDKVASAAAAAAAAAAPSPKKLVSTKRPTIMQKVVSMTRQRDLPPKPREEEEKHLTMLAEMYAASREADKHRREAEAHRAAVRAAQHAAAFPAWEASILPNWRVVLHESTEGRKLRQLWWDGTMPTRWRGRLWAMCIGNGLAVPKGAFAHAGERASRLRAVGRLGEVERAARADAQRTLPALHMFQEGAVMHDDLMEILVAWAVYEKRTPRYPDGLAFPAALLLLNLAPAEAFVCLVNLVQKSFLRSFYGDQDEVEAYYRVFDTLLADAMPKIYANFSAQVVRPSLYLLPWLSTLFAAFLPLDLATRVFDCFLLEGDSFPFRVALVLLAILEPRLFNPNLDELAAVFRGTDRGALGVVRRDKGLILADGSVDPEGSVGTDEVYAEMGATEERVFEGLARLEWKEETWARLVERELPEVV